MVRPKERLDQRIVRAGWAATRSRAQSLVREGKVSVDGVVVTKCGHLVEDTQELKLLEADHPYVSRGGLKLQHALAHWSVSVMGKFCVDVGSSTGGFTDCLLRHGAAHVTAIDVGSDQLHGSLRQDPRIRLWEQTDIRVFPAASLERLADILVADVSFISLQQVVPHCLPLLRPGGILLLLLKPQFELGPKSRDARGIVKESGLYETLVEEWLRQLAEWGLQKCAASESPIFGGDGNREFLLYAARSPA